MLINKQKYFTHIRTKTVKLLYECTVLTMH